MSFYESDSDGEFECNWCGWHMSVDDECFLCDKGFTCGVSTLLVVDCHACEECAERHNTFCEECADAAYEECEECAEECAD